MKFPQILSQLKQHQMEQQQAMELLELKNGQLESDNKKMLKELDFQKKLLYDTVRHVKLLEYALQHREKVISDVHDMIKRVRLEEHEASDNNNDSNSNQASSTASSTTDKLHEWTSQLLSILNQDNVHARELAQSAESFSLANLQKQQMQMKMRQQGSGSTERIRKGLQDLLDPNELDTYLNSREKMMKDIFEKKGTKTASKVPPPAVESADVSNINNNKSAVSSRAEVESAHEVVPSSANEEEHQDDDEEPSMTANAQGEIFSCDTLELDQKLVEKYGNQTAQKLLKKSAEYNQPAAPSISDKFSSKKSQQRKSQLDKIKKSSRLSTSSNGTVDSPTKPISSSERRGAHPKWKPKVCLRSHVDAVRSISFHPSKDLMVTASEDCTVKLWQIKKLKSSSRRIPIHTYLGHSGPVLTTSCTQDHIFTAGFSGDIRIYSFPEDGVSHDWRELHQRIIPYNTLNITNAHNDIIWNMALEERHSKLLSASSDGTVKLWNYDSFLNSSTPAATDVSTDDISANQTLSQDGQVPTSVSFYDSTKALVGHVSGDVSCYDLEKGKAVWTSHIGASQNGSSESRTCYQLEAHQQLKLGISCHEDGKLRWLDLRNGGSVAHEVVAHEDAVSCLSIDSNSGMYIATGGHDCRIRCWDMQTRQCLQDLSCHRPKNDEGIHDIAYHPYKQLLASVGADSQVRLFQ